MVNGSVAVTTVDYSAHTFLSTSAHKLIGLILNIFLNDFSCIHFHLKCRFGVNLVRIWSAVWELQLKICKNRYFSYTNIYT